MFPFPGILLAQMLRRWRDLTEWCKNIPFPCILLVLKQEYSKPWHPIGWPVADPEEMVRAERAESAGGAHGELHDSAAQTGGGLA